MDYKIDSEKISLLYNSLLENDLALTEEYEDYKRETSGPKKLEISDFIFDSDEDDEDDDEEDEKR